MSEPITTIKAIIGLAEKASPRIAVTVFIVTAILILVSWLLPGRVPWIDSVVSEHSAAVGIAMLCSGALSITYAASSLFSVTSKRREAKKAAEGKERLESERISAIHARLNSLTLVEKHILQEYIDLDRRTGQFNMTLGRHDGLVSSGILGVTQLYGVKATYMISDEAWHYLLAHRDLIATPDNPRSPRTFFGEY